MIVSQPIRTGIWKGDFRPALALPVMPIAFALALILASPSVSLASDAGAQELFIEAYFDVRDAQAAEKVSGLPLARKRYAKAKEVLQKIQKNFPSWEPTMIRYHLEACDEALRNLEAKGLVEEKPAPPEKSASELYVSVGQGRMVTLSPGEQTPSEDFQNRSNPGASATEKSGPAFTDQDLEERLAMVEGSLKERAKVQQLQVRKLMEENQHLRTRVESSETELERARGILEILDSDPRSQPVEDVETTEIPFNKKLQELTSRLQQVSAVNREQMEVLRRENTALRERTEAAELELTKTQAILEAEYVESAAEKEANQRVKRALADKDAMLTAMAGENRALMEVLSSVDQDLARARSQILSAAESRKAHFPAQTQTSPLDGKVIYLGDSNGSVVIQFGERATIPGHGEFGVYRGENLVGRIRLKEPIRPPFATAVILSGTPDVGDMIR
jgi:hypothetical protein